MSLSIKSKNRIYGTIFILVLLVLMYRLSNRNDAAWLDSAPKIAVLPLTGEIVGSRAWVNQLNDFAAERRVAGILIPINSPGGQVAPSQEMYHAIRSIRDNTDIPVYVSMGSVAASGGYYAALGADTIYANAGTLTGSIGVIIQFPNYRELMDKIGVSMNVVKSQEFKDAGSPFREMTDTERQYYQDLIDDVYDQFAEVVSLERGIDEINLATLANGRVFTGRQAQANGLVDVVGTFQDAHSQLCELLDIPIGRDLLYPPEPKRSLWKSIREDMSSALPGWDRGSSIQLQYRIPY